MFCGVPKEEPKLQLHMVLFDFEAFANNNYTLDLWHGGSVPSLILYEWNFICSSHVNMGFFFFLLLIKAGKWVGYVKLPLTVNECVTVSRYCTL